MLFEKAWQMQNKKISFLQSKMNPNVISGLQVFFSQNLFCRKNSSSKSNVLEISYSKSDKFLKFFSEIWFLSYFTGSEWMMISSVNINTSFFKEEK